jgi:hypothetical protein
VVDRADGQDGAAQAELLQLVRIIHRHLPGSALSARERVEVRRDLLLLIAETHRHAFRPHVAEEMCASVVSDVSRALTGPVRETMLRSCAPHVHRLWATPGAARPRDRDPWTFLST